MGLLKDFFVFFLRGAKASLAIAIAFYAVAVATADYTIPLGEYFSGGLWMLILASWGNAYVAGIRTVFGLFREKKTNKKIEEDV